MSVLEQQVLHYMGALRGTDRENAYHCLIELGPQVVPLLTTYFQRELDPSVRATLVSIAWHTSASDALTLLTKALDDSEPSVWKEALDGLVTVGGPAALDVIHQVRGRAQTEKAERLHEAITQISEAMADTRDADQ